MKNTKKLAFRGGVYSLIVACIVLAILVVVNIFVSSLPTSLTKYDISSSKLYSITNNTKVVVNNLDKDVNIYWVVQAGKEDSVIENLLDKYSLESDHIEVIKKNPDVYPTFTQQYTDETVSNNSLIVECGDRYRYIAYDDIYITETDMYSYSYTTSFDGEGAITSAIDYVISDEHPQLYLLQGHGESDLPSTLQDQIEKDNVEIQSISLLTVDEIPEDAACVMIYAPQSDISDKEAEILSDYANNGGKLLVLAGPVEDAELTNLYSIIADYGVTPNTGIVVEADRDHFAFQSQYVLLPDMQSDDITDSLIEDKYYPILPVSTGLNVDGTNSNVKELLTTSDDSYSKIAGYSITTYDKEDGDIDGPFALAVSIYTNNSGKIIWFSSSQFVVDSYNAYSSGANDDLCMNALSSVIDQSEAMAIRTKSLNYDYLTISDSQSALLKAIMIVIIPAVYLGVGIYMFAKTRRKQNETK